MPVFERKTPEIKEEEPKSYIFIRTCLVEHARKRDKNRIIVMPFQNDADTELSDADMNLLTELDSTFCADVGIIEINKNRINIYGNPFSFLDQSFFKNNFNRHENRRETGNIIAKNINRNISVFTYSDAN